MAAEFKIGRLKFTWEGQWTPNTFYNRDAVVGYQGKTYVCLVPNTSNSTNFYTDLYSSPYPYWNLVLDGKTFSGAWTTGTAYSLGNLVISGGVMYYCNTNHTSSTFATDAAKWAIYNEFFSWHTTWTTSTAYSLNDIVKYGGIVYKCIVNHTSASTTALGLEANQSNWSTFYSGIEYKGNWQSNYRYKANDVVKIGADLYQVTVGHTSSSIPASGNFTMYIPGQEEQGAWSSSTVYQKGDIVNYGGYSYISNTFDNTNNTPSTDTTDWSVLTQNYLLMGDWAYNVAYQVGDVVRKGGEVFVAIQDNSAQDPTSFSYTTNYNSTGSSGTTLVVTSSLGIVLGMTVVGNGFASGQYVTKIINSTTVLLSSPPDTALVNAQNLTFSGVSPYWSELSPGVRWRSFWSAGTQYTIGDLALYKNYTYRCITTHVGSVLNRPDVDTNSSFWVVYTRHATRNALVNQGDIVTYSNGATTNIPIGTNTYLLKSNGTQSNYSTILITPNVYYVAPNGVDSLTAGTSWDQPWKTIKYACNFLLKGTLNPNASTLLTSNKEFIVQEVYNYLQYTYSTNVSSSTGILFTCASTSNFVVGMPIAFGGSVFGGVTTNTQYFVQNIVNPTTFSISTTLGGSAVALSNASGAMPAYYYNPTKTQRDARLIIDSINYDLVRGGNSQTVAATLAFFAYGSSTTYINTNVATQIQYFIAALNYAYTLIPSAINQGQPARNYQALNNVASPASQIVNFSVTAESGSLSTIQSLLSIIITALTNQSTASVPTSNSGISATIYIKSGTYNETLPITVPENVALVGDELRGTVVSPNVIINTYVTYTNGNTNLITASTTNGLYDQCPIQFSGTTFGNLATATTYYVIGSTISGNQFAISITPGGGPLQQQTAVGSVSMFGGDAIQNMFLMRNGTGLRNMTLQGLLGTLSIADSNGIQQTTGGAYSSLDPGAGPNDTTTWIFRRSPYCQNVTLFGSGCVGMKIDGSLHNGGNKSMVANDYTTLIQDGIGVWCTNSDAKTELVSVFAYYSYAGYYAQNGGRIRATNGNTSYGTYGVIAEGYDSTEIPISGNVYNLSGQASASVVSAFTNSGAIQKLQYSDAGVNYTQTSTNLLQNSNNFGTGWSNDGNVSFSQNPTSPFGVTDAWTLTGTNSVANQGYLYQTISVNPQGATYTGLSASNLSGSGSNATFNVTVTSTAYVVTANFGGSGYATTNQLRIYGSVFGGITGVNDLTITVTGLSGSSILNVTGAGVVPAGSALNYTFSLYVQQGTASSIDIQGVFSGSNNSGGGINYNFGSGAITTTTSGVGTAPTLYGVNTITNGWYRIWFALNDTTGLNTSLTYNIYPRSISGTSGYTICYGPQLEINSSPSFYLETSTGTYTAYANYKIVGAGAGANLLGDELRSNAVFSTRVTDPGSGAGGAGYKTASNNAQGGAGTYIILSGADTGTSSQYTGLRIFLNSGTGAGQYGYISSYNANTKYAYILKETFVPVTVTASTGSGTNTLTLGSGDVNTLYANQPIQFIPTINTTTVTATNQASTIASVTIGGTTSTITVNSTAQMYYNQPIQFSGNVFGGVVTGYTYYVYAVIDSQTIQISQQLYGNLWPLTNGTGSMTVTYSAGTSYLYGLNATTSMSVNLAIQFVGSTLGGVTTGTTYYVQEILDSNTFTISNSLVTVTASTTTVSTDGTRPNQITVDNASNLVSLNPIIFTGSTFGNIVAGQKYWISYVPDTTHLTVTSNIIVQTATNTAITSNLITVGSTAGFIPGNPIRFTGNVFGGANLKVDTTYYILVVNDAFTFTISTQPNGSAINLSTAVGSMTVRTAGTTVALTTASGTMTGTTTAGKTTLTAGSGTMVAQFSTPIFGGVTAGTTYYIMTITPGSPNTIQITASSGSQSPVSLTTTTGSMQFGTVGWDHVNSGTPAAANLDTSTLYYIEPRVTYSAPGFNQSAVYGLPALSGITYAGFAAGDGYFMCVAASGTTIGLSSDGGTWTPLTLPTTGTWTGIAYGNKTWFIISNTTTGLWSNSNGYSWHTASLPSASWNKIAYGNNSFVIMASGTSSAVAYSNNRGATWSSGTGLSSAAWTGLAFGAGTFVAVASASQTVAYSTNNGATWTTLTSALPTSASWTAVSYGNGRFVAISSGSVSAYSFDGITWYSSSLSIGASRLVYGQGVFLALGSTTAYTSEDGINWVTRSVTGDTYSALGFGFNSSGQGIFVTAGYNSVNSSIIGSQIQAGGRARARATVASGTITSVNVWDPGSNYTSTPTVTVTDPNVTTFVVLSANTGNGSLGSPTLLNTGLSYAFSTTAITIWGSGYANEYQTGYNVVCNNITALPTPGCDVIFNGNSTIYKCTSATPLYGTVAPYLTCSIALSPSMSTALSPANGTSVIIRTKYSQCRLTNHDFLNIGLGDQVLSNYPGLPTTTSVQPQNQTIEVNNGRVFYTSTDQDGNFKVGNLFGVQQSTGIVTLSASQFGLTGLSQLSLGGISVGSSSVVITQFSTDPTFSANSDNIISTQKAIKSYVTSQLSQGGSNTTTGQLTAGTVVVGGPNLITSSIPQGISGSTVKINVKVNIVGSNGAVDGNLAALNFFIKNASRKTR